MKAAAVLARLFLCLAFVAGGGVAYAFVLSEEGKAEIEELKQKAAQGDAEAQYNLGNKYTGSSKGVLPNYKEAARLYRLAAEQGYFAAQYYLGIMYLNGQGVAQNYSEAYIWLALAVLADTGVAIKKRREAEEKLTTDELNQAQAEAAKRLEEIKKRTAAAQ